MARRRRVGTVEVVVVVLVDVEELLAITFAFVLVFVPEGVAMALAAVVEVLVRMAVGDAEDDIHSIALRHGSCPFLCPPPATP